MPMKPLITPTVNLNGNSAESLINQLIKVMEALRDAEAAFQNNADVTHGRNFQTAMFPVADVRDAGHAWGERRLLLKQMREEVEQLALAIQAQGR